MMSYLGSVGIYYTALECIWDHRYATRRNISGIAATITH